MAFQILEILNPETEGVLAKVLHQDNPVTVTIRGGKDEVAAGKTIQAEIDYDTIVAWNVIDDFSDDQSGIWQEQDGIHLAGRIHNVVDYGGGKTIVDVYMHNGPEFFTATSATMENLMFDASMGLEIVVKTLYLYPTS